MRFVILICLILFGCSTVKQIQKSNGPRLVGNRFYELKILNGPSSHLPDSITSKFIFVRSPKEIFITSSFLPSDTTKENVYYFVSKFKSDINDSTQWYSYKSETNKVEVIIEANNLGEIIGGDFCANCDNDNTIISLNAINLICCKHREKHCCDTLKEAVEISKKYKCVWK